MSDISMGLNPNDAPKSSDSNTWQVAAEIDDGERFNEYSGSQYSHDEKHRRGEEAEEAEVEEGYLQRLIENLTNLLVHDVAGVVSPKGGTWVTELEQLTRTDIKLSATTKKAIRVFLDEARSHGATMQLLVDDMAHRLTKTKLAYDADSESRLADAVELRNDEAPTGPIGGFAGTSIFDSLRG